MGNNAFQAEVIRLDQWKDLLADFTIRPGIEDV